MTKPLTDADVDRLLKWLHEKPKDVLGNLFKQINDDRIN